jgi:hypothetical protein
VLKKPWIKKIFQIVLATVSSLFIAYMTFAYIGLGAMGRIPGETDLLINKLFYTNALLVVVAVILSFFLKPKGSFLVFAVQCLVFIGVIYASTYLVPAEKERNLRANYKKINTRIINDAETILECKQGYRVAFLAPAKTSTGKTVSTLHLVPPNLEDEPHQILSWVDGNVGNVFIKHSHKHLDTVLPSCKNNNTTFDQLVTRIKNM